MKSLLSLCVLLLSFTAHAQWSYTCNAYSVEYEQGHILRAQNRVDMQLRSEDEYTQNYEAEISISFAGGTCRGRIYTEVIKADPTYIKDRNEVRGRTTFETSVIARGEASTVVQWTTPGNQEYACDCVRHPKR